MIKNIAKIAVIAIATLTFAACNNNSKVKTEESKVNQTGDTSSGTEKTENGPEIVVYNVSPDSAVLGKTGEAHVKILEATSLNLQDADGKATGAELTVKLSITNKSTLENQKYFSLSVYDSRLLLDNGNSVPGTKDTGNNGPKAESTSEASWTYELPAGAKPSKLNFFLDGTRVAVNLSKK